MDITKKEYYKSTFIISNRKYHGLQKSTIITKHPITTNTYNNMLNNIGGVNLSHALRTWYFHMRVFGMYLIKFNYE